MSHIAPDSPATLILVRHGTVANPNHVVYSDLPGFDLDPIGVMEAQQVGRHLASVRVDRVVSSPLERARSTANAIARWHGLPVVIDERATEWRLSSRWIGQRWDDLPSLVPGELDAYLTDPADLPFAEETLSEVAHRMTHLVAGIATIGGHCTVVVSHQDTVAATVLALLDEPLAGLLDDPPPHASATTLRHSPDGWELVDRWSPERG